MTSTIPKGIRILVVEDNTSDLKLVRSILISSGYEVSDATTAEAAIEALNQSHPQVILTDLKLPQMDGLSLARHLKQGSRTADIPLIAMTSYPDAFARSSVNEAGFAACLHKPLNTRTLSRQISGICTRH